MELQDTAPGLSNLKTHSGWHQPGLMHLFKPKCAEDVTCLMAGKQHCKSKHGNRICAFSYNRFSGDLAISAPVYADTINKDGIEAYVSISYKPF